MMFFRRYLPLIAAALTLNLALSSPTLANVTATTEKPAPLSKAQVQSLLPLTAGSYNAELSAGPALDFCDNETLQIAWLDSSDSLTLTFGASLALPHLELNTYSEKTLPGCEIQFTNTLSQKQLKQTVQQSCKDKKQNFSKLHELQVTTTGLEYQYSYKGAKKSQALTQKSVCKLTPLKTKD